MTISPTLLGELAASDAPLEPRLSVAAAKADAPEWVASNEVVFRTHLNEDAMATEKLAEGIRIFTADAIKLDALLE